MTATTAAKIDVHRTDARRETRSLKTSAARHSAALAEATRALELLAAGDGIAARCALLSARDRLSGARPHARWDDRYARLRACVNVLLDGM